MAVSPARRLFTVDEYHRMVEAGILGEDDRVELIDGEIIAMTPIGPRHAFTVRQLARLFIEELGSTAVVGVQDPVTLDDLSEPQPDILIAQPPIDRYSSRHPAPEDLLLLVEVADASVRTDRESKVPRYLATGVREVWLVDLDHERFEVYRLSSDHAGPRIVGRGEQVGPEAFPDLLIDINEVLGPRT